MMPGLETWLEDTIALLRMVLHYLGLNPVSANEYYDWRTGADEFLLTGRNRSLIRLIATNLPLNSKARIYLPLISMSEYQAHHGRKVLCRAESYDSLYSADSSCSTDLANDLQVATLADVGWLQDDNAAAAAPKLRVEFLNNRFKQKPKSTSNRHEDPDYPRASTPIFEVSHQSFTSHHSLVTSHQSSFADPAALQKISALEDELSVLRQQIAFIVTMQKPAEAESHQVSLHSWNDMRPPLPVQSTIPTLPTPSSVPSVELTLSTPLPRPMQPVILPLPPSPPLPPPPALMLHPACDSSQMSLSSIGAAPDSCPPPPPEVPKPPRPDAPPPPPPPPPPPTTSTPVTDVVQIIKMRKERNSSVSVQNVTIPRVPDLSEVLKGIGSVKLRSIKRSPGGTPIREKPLPSKSQDPAAMIALALKRKFSNTQVYSPDKENRQTPTPESSPAEKRSPVFGQHLLRQTKHRRRSSSKQSSPLAVIDSNSVQLK